MTQIDTHDLNCPCGHKFKVELYSSINITLNPNLLKDFYDGKINVVECPNCHTKGFINKPFLFHDMMKQLLIEVKGENINGFMHFLDSKGYFDNFKKQKP